MICRVVAADHDTIFAVHRRERFLGGDHQLRAHNRAVQERIDPSPELLGLAHAQGGVVSVQQTEMLGLGRHPRQRLLRSGQWQRLEGAILVVHPFEVPWEGRAWAGVLLGGREARLSGLAAAYLHGLTTAPPDQIDVLTRSAVPDRDPWLFHRDLADVRSPRSPGAPPRTTIEDTVLDLCQNADSKELVHWLTQAVQTRRTSASRLREALERRKRHGRRAPLRELLGDVAAGVESPLELRYLRDVERAHGLPKADRQESNRRRHRRDVRYSAFGVVVELDGRLGHEGLGRFRDMARDNGALLDGEITLRYGFADVSGEACTVARQVYAVLRSRGHDGELRRCARCVAVPEQDAWMAS